MKAFSTTSEARGVPSVCFFDRKVSLPQLERLVLEAMESLEKMWPDEPSNEDLNSFSRLRSLKIIKCKNLSSSLVPTTLIYKLQKLEQVLVEECESLEVLFDCGSSQIQNLPTHECEALMLPELHRLTLSKLTELKYICKGGNSNIPFGLPSLNEVGVSNCKNLIHLFPEATARTLLQLKSLDIEECASMQQIVSKQDGEEQADLVPISFPHLKQLKLSKLVSLNCFASGGCEFEFLSLEALHISECIGLKTLIQRPTFDNDPLDTRTPSFFDDKVELPNLDNLYLYDVAVHKVWTDDNEQPPSDSFSKLKSLEIGSCTNLVTVIPFNMLRRLGNLEKLKISNCIILEEIFQMEEVLNCDDATGGGPNTVMIMDGSVSGNPEIYKVEVSFPKLETLELSGLGKLKEIWSVRHSSSMEFGHLESLKVTDCGSLSICIPSGVVKSLNQLKSLTMKSCSSIQHVFDIQGLELTGRDNEEIVLLPAMEKLILVDLSSLIGILTDSISTDQTIFRKLKTVEVEKCHSLMNIFSLKTAQCLDNVLERLSIVECKEVRAIILVDSSSSADTLDFPELKVVKLEELPLLATFVGGTQDIAGPVCLFSKKVALPVLEKLCIISSMESLEKIWSSELPNQESFSKLRVLRIIGCKKLTLLVQITLAKQLQSLEEVNVEKCESMGVLFDYGGVSSMLPKLQILKVQDLTKLKNIFDGNQDVLFDLPSLEKVQLSKCKELIHLFPNTATARTLSKLGSIKIGECENMKQVVRTVLARQEQARQQISFPRLCSVELSKLGRLYSFAFAPKTCEVEFPSLVTLSISDCSTLKTFIDRPGVHSLFDDKVAFPKLEKMLLCDVGMQKVWNNDGSIPSGYFSELKSLKIERCQNLVTLIPSNMFRRLQNLEKIVVQNCIVLKELLQLEGLNQLQDGNEEIEFNKLKVVSSGCPALDQYVSRIRLLLQKISPQ